MPIKPSFNIREYSFTPNVQAHSGHFDFTPNIGIGTYVYLRLVSMYVNAQDRLIGVYQDGSSSDVGSVADLPVTVIYQTSSLNFRVDGETLYMTSTNSQ